MALSGERAEIGHFDCHGFAPALRSAVASAINNQFCVFMEDAMEVLTSRFGRVEMRAEDVILFPNGLLGMEDCRHWVLFADASNELLGWLQSLSRADLAFAVVSPRSFVPDFQLRVARSELMPLALDDVQQAQVLAIVGKNERGITLNLRAPLVINEERRIGRQVITNNDAPIQYELASDSTPMRKVA
jgi:flagellar assembly factor FliW